MRPNFLFYFLIFKDFYILKIMEDDNNHYLEYNIDFNDENYLLTMQNMLNDLQYYGINMNSINEVNSSIENTENSENNNNQTDRYVIEFQFNIQPNQNIEDLPNYFKNVKQINEVLGMPKYIHKKDECLLKDCSICLEKLEYKKYKRILPCCKNVFHKTCIDKWFKKNSSCPICRHDFLEKKEESEENN